MKQTLKIVSPLAGATVSGTVTVSVESTNVKRVNFSVDGHAVGSDVTWPFVDAIDTTKLPDGLHTIKATSGNGMVHSTVSVTVKNAVPPPPPPVADPDVPPVPVGALLFDEEFDGTTIDTAKWEGKHYRAGSGTQWNYLANAKLDGNGCLDITAKLVNGQWYSTFLAALAPDFPKVNGFAYKGPRYTCARVKVPPEIGTFPAAPWEWAAPYGAGPIEIDYMEILGKSLSILHTTLHPWLPSGDHEIGHANDVGVDLSKDFHVYGGAVYADHIDFYFDGHLVWTADASQSGLGPLTDYPVVPCIDLDMGGWGGPIDPAITQATMLVKYLRSYALA